MILSDREIQEELYFGRIKIEGLDHRDIGPASVDLYLGNSFIGGVSFCDGELILEPGRFALATTREVLTLPDNIMGQVQGCSSIGRTGLFVQNAGLIDPGFSGEITLELFNAGADDFVLEHSQRICQVSFAYLSSACIRPYGLRGRYQNQRGATSARPPRSNGL